MPLFQIERKKKPSTRRHLSEPVVLIDPDEDLQPGETRKIDFDDGHAIKIGLDESGNLVRSDLIPPGVDPDSVEASIRLDPTLGTREVLGEGYSAGFLRQKKKS